MSLTDLMSHSDLSIYPQFALLIFLMVFAAMTWRLFHRRTAAEYVEAAYLPLEDGVAIDRHSHSNPSDVKHREPNTIEQELNL